jgi:hypothetical protein
VNERTISQTWRRMGVGDAEQINAFGNFSRIV